MKKLNLFLMMLASLSLITLSSCKKDDPIPVEKDITISVSGGTSVTVEGTDIAKDITVTATEKVTKDVVVNITSNAAEGEATITPAQVTIKKGEISATSKITFALAKFPKGTAEKKITVTIISPTEGVELGTATTDFLVKGEGGKELIALTITANEEKFNTTAAEVPVTFTFTLATPNATEFPVGVTFGEGTSEAIKTLFAPLTAVKFAANATAPVVVTVKVPKGTEGKLIANFAVEDKAIDLKTTTLSVTFIVDQPPLPTLTITGSETSFNTTTENKTLTVTYTLSEKLAKELDITINYNGSSNAIKELFANRTSMKIGAEIETATMDFEVTQGISGKLVLNFEINNEDATLLTPKLEATFINDNAPATFSLERVTTGDVIVPKIGDETDVFKVTLSKASTGAVVTLTSSDPTNGAVASNPVTFEGTETSQEVTITFLSSYFTDEAVTKDITVTGASTLTAETAAITYHVKGEADDVPIAVLCQIGGNSWNGFYTKGFTVGDYTSTPHTENVPYTDLTESVVANISNNGAIAITGVNLESGPTDDYLAIAWVDWDRNGTIGSDEVAMKVVFKAGDMSGTATTSNGTLTVPSGAKSGKYAMRIGTTYEKDDTNNGCSDEHETFDFTDLIINYTAQ